LGLGVSPKGAEEKQGPNRGKPRGKTFIRARTLVDSKKPSRKKKKKKGGNPEGFPPFNVTPNQKKIPSGGIIPPKGSWGPIPRAKKPEHPQTEKKKRNVDPKNKRKMRRDTQEWGGKRKAETPKGDEAQTTKRKRGVS